MKYIILIIFSISISINTAYAYRASKITIYGQKTFSANVLIANKPKEWILGLMFIRHLDKNTGLLMIMPPAKVAIWMKNMLMPIDCIYILNNRVVNIYKNLPVCATKNCKKYYSDTLVNRVLEVNAGIAEEYGIKKNDKVKLNLN
ncbi:MAG: DUF192 domain-containing protein [Candidatus Acididesulfobacter guangdongensis]|uniref:DUF192 domain-containing protein n=1 Tax=Acididesulfobacter guangdongensis TaxID=2597225 RepID=A0A519BHD1_ACIG2|nr:MAG: DUF192 domain-containing protein [Candidatus Acididesulfobacter guangdongensis]